MSGSGLNARTARFFSVLATAGILFGLGVIIPLAQTAPRAEAGTVEALPSSSFASCIQEVGTQAQVEGISQEVISQSLGGLSPDPDILAGVQQQPEFIKPIWDYLDATVTDARIDTGRAKLAEWSQVLDAVENAYGVDRHIVLAIWGIESSYGAVLDDPTIVKPVIRSLATLACGDANRAGFWRE